MDHDYKKKKKDETHGKQVYVAQKKWPGQARHIGTVNLQAKDNSARLFYQHGLRMFLPISRLSSKFIRVIGEDCTFGSLCHFEKSHFPSAITNWICIFRALRIRGARKLPEKPALFFMWHVTRLDNFDAFVKARSKADCHASVPNRFTVSTLDFLRYRNKSHAQHAKSSREGRDGKDRIRDSRSKGEGKKKGKRARNTRRGLQSPRYVFVWWSPLSHT